MKLQIGKEDLSNPKLPRTRRNAGVALDLQAAKPANDNNLKGVWPLSPFPDNWSTQIISEKVIGGSTPIAEFRRTLRRKTVLPAYGIAVCLATVGWFYALGLAFLTLIDWLVGY